MSRVKVRLMGLMQFYPPEMAQGVLEIEVDASDSVEELMARVGARVGEHLIPALWDVGTRRFHDAVHVFLDGVQVHDRQSLVGNAQDATLLLQIAGGATK